MKFFKRNDPLNEALARQLGAAFDGFIDETLSVETPPVNRLSHATDAIEKVVNQAEAEAVRLDGEMAFERERHALRIADLTEQRRQCISIVTRCQPAVEGMIDDFHSDPVNVVPLASKRKRSKQLEAAE